METSVTTTLSFIPSFVADVLGETFKPSFDLLSKSFYVNKSSSEPPSSAAIDNMTWDNLIDYNVEIEHSENAALLENGSDLQVNDDPLKRGNESTMRLSTDGSTSRRQMRKDRILSRRGSFHALPVGFSNDLVHGSWWFVLGSIVATIIPIVPLVDLFYPFWPHSSSSLPLFDDVWCFVLLIISGFFFTLGSLAFVRAVEEPPKKPLFSSYHLATDELLAAWLFLLATIPFVPFIGVYVYYNRHVYVYWGCLVGSILFVVATYFFVLSCYPNDQEREQIIPQVAQQLLGPQNWINKHLSNDWLAAMWIFFYGTLVMFIGSVIMLIQAIQDGNQLEIFDWASSTVDSVIFLIGSAYFCAGSYPHNEQALVTVNEKYVPIIQNDSEHYDNDIDESTPLFQSSLTYQSSIVADTDDDLLISTADDDSKDPIYYI